MSDRWTDSISEYLDGCMEPAARRDLEAHLQACGECSATLEDLRGIVARAASLPAPTPPSEVWAGIEARLRTDADASVPSPRERPRAMRARTAPWTSWRISLTVPQLAAACVAVIALSGGLAYILSRPGGDRDLAAVPGPTGTVATVGTSGAADPTMEDIEELRRILAAGRDRLDPATIRSLQESLIAIDTAIRQGRTALQADPQNPYVRDHLDETMRRKVDLLRRATQLASATE